MTNMEELEEGDINTGANGGEENGFTKFRNQKHWEKRRLANLNKKDEGTSGAASSGVGENEKDDMENEARVLSFLLFLSLSLAMLCNKWYLAYMGRFISVTCISRTMML